MDSFARTAIKISIFHFQWIFSVSIDLVRCLQTAPAEFHHRLWHEFGASAKSIGFEVLSDGRAKRVIVWRAVDIPVFSMWGI